MSSTEKTPPYDAEAEESVLASLMVDDTAFDAIEQLVTTTDFFGSGNGAIFDACRRLWQRAEAVNQVTVAHELGDQLECAGGIARLSRLVSDLPTPVGVEHYAAIVRRDARYRRAIQVGSQIVQGAYAGGADIDGYLTRCEHMLASLADEGATVIPRLDQLIDDYLATETIRDRNTAHVRTGILELDDLLQGLKPGTLTIVAAQTGVGKSVLLANIAKNALIGQNFRVVVLSLEMGRAEWRDRVVANIEGIPIDQLTRGFNALNDDDMTRVLHTRGLVDAAPLHIDDRSRTTVEQMRATLRGLRAKLGGLDLVLVDYLQLVGGAHRDFRSREQEVAAISRGLKLLARELDCPVIAASQLSRQIDARMQNDAPAIPRLSDLRESGALEQDADVVLFMYRAEKRAEWPQKFGEGSGGGVVRLIVAKARNGRTGHCYARMHDHIARIEDVETTVAPEPEYQETMPWAR